MKKSFWLAALIADLVLFFAACSNSSDSGIVPLVFPTATTSNPTATPDQNLNAPRGKYEKNLTIDLSAASDRLSADGVANLSAGKDVSDWFKNNMVASSTANGFTDFKATIVSASETSLVIKVSASTPAVKCSISLSITIPKDFTASGQPVVKINIDTLIVNEDGSQKFEILQSAHAKVEKVAGGLKFTITRPTEDVFNPQKVVKEETFNHYEYVGAGNGDYGWTVEYVGEKGDLKNIYEYVGQGNGCYKLTGKNHYKEVGFWHGEYKITWTPVGDGMGDYKIEDACPLYVGEGNGDYKYEYALAPGKGNYIYSEELVDEYLYVGDGNGDYTSYLMSVKDESGDYKSGYIYVGEGNGDNKYVNDTVKTYGNWTNVFITTSGGLSNGVVQAVLDLGSPDKDVLSVFWPLCKPGKLCEYTIQIEPYDGNLRDSILYEKLAVVADDGIGDLAVQKLGNITLSYDGVKPTIKAESFEFTDEKAQNIKTRYAFYATNQSELKDGGPDWSANNAVMWFWGEEVSIAQSEFVWDDEATKNSWKGQTFEEMFNATNKDTLYVDRHITFDIPKSSGDIAYWEILPAGDALKKIR